MGKLIISSKHRLAEGVISLAVGAGLFIMVQPFIESTVKAAGTYTVGSEVVNGYQQIYLDDGEKMFITSGRENHSQAVIADNRYVAYTTSTDDGLSQIMQHDILTQETITLASVGTNLQPKADDDKVVWKSWVVDRWQIFLYDGSSVHQISSGQSASRQDIENGLIVYASKNEAGQWEAYQYAVKNKKTTLLGTGDSFAWPYFSNGSVIYGYRNF